MTEEPKKKRQKASKPHKSITLEPDLIIDDTTGETLDKEPILELLKTDTINITELTEWNLRSDHSLLENIEEYLEDYPRDKNSIIGRNLKITIPAIIKQEQSPTGRSRYQAIYQDKVIREARSWLARSKAAQGTSEQYVSRGWARTADATRPTELAPKISTSAADAQYVKFLNDPLKEGIIDLRLVIGGKWYILLFTMHKPKRFTGAKKICLPDIRVDENGKVKFDFAFEFPYQYSLFSSEYVIGVDAGVARYATYCVIEARTGLIVEQGTLSQRAHFLENSISASARQVASLRRLDRAEEAVPHREKNSRKRKELAIIAAQEIADASARYGNAVVVFENLGHIENTMMFGRWARGLLVDWTTHFVELNGGRVFRTNPAYSSQDCSSCGSRGYCGDRRFFHCKNSECGVIIDRDLNAAANIALFFVGAGSWVKALKSRKSATKSTTEFFRRSAKVTKTLKHPGRAPKVKGRYDRTKNKPTPKQPTPKPSPSLLGEVNKEKDSNCPGVGVIPPTPVPSDAINNVVTQDSQEATRYNTLRYYRLE